MISTVLRSFIFDAHEHYSALYFPSFFRFYLLFFKIIPLRWCAYLAYCFFVVAKPSSASDLRLYLLGWKSIERAFLRRPFYNTYLPSKYIPPRRLFLYGFSRSGTSYLQNHLHLYFHSSSFVLSDGSFSRTISSLKHSLEFFKYVTNVYSDSLTIIVPVRKLFDILVSYSIYDPSILNKSSLSNLISSYSLSLEWLESCNGSSCILPIRFETLTALTPLQLAFKLSLKLNIVSDIGEDISVEDVFKRSAFGDSTGLSSAKSLSNPTKSHLPNNLKRSIGPFYREYILSIVSSRQCQALEYKRLALLANSSSI